MRKATEDERLLGRLTDFVSAWFGDLDDAEAATRDLVESGFPRDRITVLLSDETRDAYLEIHPEYSELGRRHVLTPDAELEPGTKAWKGAGVGAAAGGTIGAVAAAAAAIGTTLVVPPLGIVVAGPLAAAFAGAGAGGAAGTLVGALAGSGMEEYRARRFEELIRKGGVVVGVHTMSAPETTAARRVLEDHGGTFIRRDEEEAAEERDEG